MRITHLLYTLSVFVLLVFLCGGGDVAAQSYTVYPSTLYSGENVLTIYSPQGIERVSLSTTAGITTISSPGFIRDCPDSVQVRLQVVSVTSDEAVTLTIYECDGKYGTATIQSEDWTIKHEYTGKVEIGADTCLRCFVESTSPRLLDSIVVRNSSVRVEIGEKPYRDIYRVRGGIPFQYNICYQPSREESVTDTIYLYFKRDMPNGGIDSYVIVKPLTLQSILPRVDTSKAIPKIELPPLRDPTTYRNIVMPTAESPLQGKVFYGNYMIVGNIAGYGLTDRLSLLGGGVFVPDFISKLYVGTIGAKFEFLRTGLLSGAVGTQYAISSSEESDINTFAPYIVGSLGDHEHRVSIAAGYGLKRHVTSVETFNRNAFTVALGGYTTFSRGWKLAAEWYGIESSGVSPLVVTARTFTNKFAFDFGLGFDLAQGSDIFFKDAFSGEVTSLAIAPVLSAMWVF
ncbi:MAG: hypothetical protein AB7H80_05645 [Candidatus Kapaibacterium sp.]